MRPNCKDARNCDAWYVQVGWRVGVYVRVAVYGAGADTSTYSRLIRAYSRTVRERVRNRAPGRVTTLISKTEGEIRALNHPDF
eukprot:470423-Prymnesium_polylepis.1